jgi:hypothetical protein
MGPARGHRGKIMSHFDFFGDTMQSGAGWNSWKIACPEIFHG